MKKATDRILAKFAPKKKNRFSIFSLIIIFFLALYCLFLIILFVWAILASFKEPVFEWRENVIGLPYSFYTGNYEFSFARFYVDVTDPVTSQSIQITLPYMFLYGFLYALGCALAATIVPMVVGYVTSKYRYKFSSVIYFIVIIVMIIPIVGSLPAEIRMARRFGLFDQIWGMWILKANFLGLYFLVFYNFFRNLPDAYNEAAKIDGAGNFRTMIQIIIPLAAPLFFTVLLINFINFWNDYTVPLIYLPTYPTIAVGMHQMAAGNDKELQYIPIKLSAAIIMLIPILVVFLAAHRKLLGNLTMGGIKG